MKRNRKSTNMEKKRITSLLIRQKGGPLVLTKTGWAVEKKGYFAGGRWGPTTRGGVIQEKRQERKKGIVWKISLKEKKHGVFTVMPNEELLTIDLQEKKKKRLGKACGN